MLYPLLKPILFQLPPETAHEWTMAHFQRSLQVPLLGNQLKQAYIGAPDPLDCMGLHFTNRVGLAAGFDKNGQYLNQLQYLGFGFVEVGTVTPKPQVGNPKPRLFRLPKDQALINRMGFNNQGVHALQTRLNDWRQQFPNHPMIIGGNIGKNKDTPNENAVQDYLACFHALSALVDYFVVNVSSPNTPNLRALQDKEPLKKLLSTLQDANHQLANPKPLLLKIAPDLTAGQLDDIAQIAIDTQLSGIVSNNTTISRKGLKTAEKTIHEIGNGGLSGAPIEAASNEILTALRQRIPKDISIIAVGGITTPKAASHKIALGADLVQIYTGLIYYGPALAKDISNKLRNRET